MGLWFKPPVWVPGGGDSLLQGLGQAPTQGLTFRSPTFVAS